MLFSIYYSTIYLFTSFKHYDEKPDFVCAAMLMWLIMHLPPDTFIRRCVFGYMIVVCGYDIYTFVSEEVKVIRLFCHAVVRERSSIRISQG